MEILKIRLRRIESLMVFGFPSRATGCVISSRYISLMVFTVVKRFSERYGVPIPFYGVRQYIPQGMRWVIKP
jgi:hypothetical protein